MLLPSASTTSSPSTRGKRRGFPHLPRVSAPAIYLWVREPFAAFQLKGSKHILHKTEGREARGKLFREATNQAQLVGTLRARQGSSAMLSPCQCCLCSILLEGSLHTSITTSRSQFQQSCLHSHSMCPAPCCGADPITETPTLSKRGCGAPALR